MPQFITDMQQLVSFIIPCFNHGSFLKEAIASVKNQNYTHFEVVIVDDGSEPETISVLQELAVENPEFKIIYQENSGPSVARNRGISESSGTYFVFLDADDLILPETVSAGVNILAENSAVGVVYGNLIHFGTKKGLVIQETIDLHKMLVYNQIAVSAIIRKEVVEQCGGFDDFMSKKGLEDWEFWIRVAFHGWSFYHLNEPTFKIRWQEKSRTYQTANKNLKELKAYVFQKHASKIADFYESFYYENKMQKESPDYKIGSFLLKPYRWTKKFFS